MLGVHIVTGWQAAEYKQMIFWPGNVYFGYRYDSKLPLDVKVL